MLPETLVRHGGRDLCSHASAKSPEAPSKITASGSLKPHRCNGGPEQRVVANLGRTDPTDNTPNDPAPSLRRYCRRQPTLPDQMACKQALPLAPSCRGVTFWEQANLTGISGELCPTRLTGGSPLFIVEWGLRDLEDLTERRPMFQQSDRGIEGHILAAASALSLGAALDRQPAATLSEVSRTDALAGTRPIRSPS